MTDYTPNYPFRLIDFDAAPWHEDEYANWRLVDTLLSLYIPITGVIGIWETSTAYVIDNRLIDDSDGTLWQCLVDHTSASSGTFAQDRVANPTYWDQITGPSNAWGDIISKPTTIAGFGITDAYTKTETNTLLSNKSNISHDHNTLYYPRADVDILIDAVELLALLSGSYTTTTGGTVDATTVTFSPAFTAYATGMRLRYPSVGPNTVTTPNTNVDGLGAKTIKKGAGASLAVGDLGPTGYMLDMTYDGTDMILHNPYIASATTTSEGLVELATTAEAAALSDTTRAVTAAGVKAAVTGKKALWVPASAMLAKTTNGAGFSSYDSGSNDVTIRTADFDATTQEYAQFTIAMPDMWDEGTISFVPYWTNTGGSAGQTVVFSLAAAAISDDDTINVSMGTAQTSTDAWLAQNDLHRGPESTAITIGGTPQANDLVVFEVSRVVASDDMAGDAKLIGIMLYMTTNATNEP